MRSLLFFGELLLSADYNSEIFGPVLPIVPVKDVDEAVKFIRAREHPLAVYVFSNDKEFEKKGTSDACPTSRPPPLTCNISCAVFSNTKSGAAVTNETVISAGVPGLPVGGVGASGYGYYTGKHAFEQFSHYRVSLKNPAWVDAVAFSFRYPPYKVSTNTLLVACSPTSGKDSHIAD